MISYVDPIPPVRRLLDEMMDERVYGNKIPSTGTLPAVLVRSVGGTDYTRLQVLARANDDIQAMGVLIRAMNILEQNASFIRGLRVSWIEAETNPIHAEDEDTGKPEAWCYMRMEHLEA
jgi:hypothetical protein